jgi:enoyl-CoA hydratase
MSLVLTDTENYVRTITLNRPEKLNALSNALVGDLLQALDEAEKDSEVRVVVLTGSGRAFSSGADLSGQGTGHQRDLGQWSERLGKHMRDQFRLRDYPKPIIAAVNGYCLGRGCELALWCDIVLASDDAQFGEPEIRHGSMVASMVTWLANPQHAKLLILTGDTISAEEASKIGLVARVVPAAQLQAEAARLAARIAKVPPFAVQYNKKAINAAYDAMGFRSAMAYGHEMEVMCHFSGRNAENVDGVPLKDVRQQSGFRAFLEARDGPFRDNA